MLQDWTKLYKKYKGLWVALDHDEETVLAVGKSAPEAYKKAVKEGHKDPIMAHMPRTLEAYVGHGI